MPKQTFRIREGETLLDVVSYGRGRSSESGGRLTPAQVEQIRRTARRTPEVVVKVLPRASNDLKAVGKHLDYIGRNGELELETDDGDRLSGRIGKDLLDDWDLDLDDVRRQGTLAATKGREPPKLVHKLMFSMPPGTPPDKVLGAVRNFTYLGLASHCIGGNREKGRGRRRRKGEIPERNDSHVRGRSLYPCFGPP